jgi:hypothetical protein
MRSYKSLPSGGGQEKLIRVAAPVVSYSFVRRKSGDLVMGICR